MTIFTALLVLAGSFLIHHLTLVYVYRIWLAGSVAGEAGAAAQPPHRRGSWRARWWRIGYETQFIDRERRSALRERDHARLQASAVGGVLEVMLPEVEEVEPSAAPAASRGGVLS